MRVRLTAIDPAMLVPMGAALTGAVIVITIGLIAGPGTVRGTARDQRGIPRCPARAAQDLLSADALQCWFEAPHGRWRTLSHVAAPGSVVVRAEATAILDAEYIARAFVKDRAGKSTEVLVYVQEERAKGSTLIRRVAWTAASGFTRLEFVGDAGQ
jgi:hypothetical protein